MRHRVFGKKLGRNHNERQALFKALTRQIFTYGTIETTETKAQAVASKIEALCTIAKKNDLNARRRLFEDLQNQSQVNLVVERINQVFPQQNSNFLKMVRIKRRQGDDALIVKLSFVKPIDFVVKEKPVENPKVVKKEEPKKIKKVTKKAKE